MPLPGSVAGCDHALNPGSIELLAMPWHQGVGGVPGRSRGPRQRHLHCLSDNRCDAGSPCRAGGPAFRSGNQRLSGVPLHRSLRCFPGQPCRTHYANLHLVSRNEFYCLVSGRSGDPSPRPRIHGLHECNVPRQLRGEANADRPQWKKLSDLPGLSQSQAVFPATPVGGCPASMQKDWACDGRLRAEQPASHGVFT